MRLSFLAFLIMLLGVAAYGQNPAATSPLQSDIRIVDAKWVTSGGDVDSGYGGWPGDAAYTTVAGAISKGVSTFHASGNTVSYQSPSGLLVRAPGKGRSSVLCTPTVVVLNTGTKTIKAFDLDYIFSDRQTKSEFLRYRFRAKEKIGSGKTAKVTQDVFQKVGRYRKRFTPLQPSVDVLLHTNDSLKNVVVRRIEYSDGSVWQKP